MAVFPHITCIVAKPEKHDYRAAQDMVTAAYDLGMLLAESDWLKVIA